MNTQNWNFQRTGQDLRALMLCALSLAAACQMNSAAAEPLSTEPNTLRQAVDAALERLPESHSSAQRREAADAQARASRSWTAEPPVLELSMKSDRLNSNLGAREMVAGVAASLWLPGQREQTMALAKAEQDADPLRLQAARWRAAGLVREAWWGIHSARNDVAVAQNRVSHAEQLVRDVERRVRAGDLARADQHQADALLSSAVAELASARSGQGRALQALRMLTGRPAAAPPVAEPEAVPASTAATVTSAVDGHPAVQELTARAELARRAFDLAGTQTRANPELTLATTRERTASGSPSDQSISLGVRIPFGSSDRHAAKLAAAGALRTEAEIQLALERERIAGDIELAQQRIANLRVGAEAAQRRATLGRELQGFNEKAFRLGQTDLPGRLRIDMEAFEAERQAARAQIELASAISQLRQALGLMPE